MANESTYAGISTLIASIYEAAWLTARERSVIAPLVTNMSSDSSTPRVFSSYSGGTIQTIAETDDMSAQAFTKVASGTITPAQYGAQYFITDQRIDSDPQGVIADAGRDLGELLAKHIDTNLISLFSSFTGGTVGTAGGTLTWQNVMRAGAYLRAQNASGPFVASVRPESWYYLTSASSGVPTLLPSQNFMNGLYSASNFFQGGYGDMGFFIDANITSGTAAVGGMFARDAIVLDVRRAFRIERQRDASRGGGGWELNATMIYGYGLKRANFGVQLIGTSA